MEKNLMIKWLKILIIILAVLGAVFYLFSMTINTDSVTSSQSVNIEIQKKLATDASATLSKKDFPEIVSGKVVGVNSESWIIEQSAGALEVKINVDTTVFKNEGSEKKKVSVTDVKAGTIITANLKKETGEVADAIIVE